MTTLSTRRFLRTAALMDSANEHERSTAVRQASAMLREAGLDWTTVLKAGLKHLGLDEAGGTPAFADAVSSGRASPFQDIFSQFFGGDMFRPGAGTHRSSAGQPAPAASQSTAEVVAEALGEKPQRFKRRTTAVTHVGGDKVPAFIHGTVKVIEDRRTDRTPALIVAVCDGEIEYGPLIAFAKLDELLSLASAGTAAQGRVAQPAAVYHLPRFTLTR